MAKIYDIQIDQGATFRRTLELQDAEGEPYALTGATAKAQIRETYSSDEVIAEFEIQIDEPAGKITFSMEPEDTAAIDVPAAKDHRRPSKFFIYDLELTEADGTVTRLIQGTVEVSPEATRE